MLRAISISRWLFQPGSCDIAKLRYQIQASIPQTIQLSTPAPSSDSEATSTHFPPPPPAIELTPLLGHPPSEELHTFYNLLVSQLSTIIWHSEGSEYGFRRPVVVGLALKKSKGDEEDEGRLERQFRGICEAVTEMLRS